MLPYDSTSSPYSAIGLRDGARPCYLQFSEDAVEDRAATQAAGHVVYKDIVWVDVTPPGKAGTNTIVRRIAEEWLASKEQQGDPFAKFYRDAYKQWCATREIPLQGTSLRLWPALSKAEIEQIFQANIRTVEDLAAADQGTLEKIGPGARGYKNRAEAWLRVAKDTGVMASHLETLETKINDLAERNKELEQQVAGLKTQLAPAPEPPKRQTLRIS